MFRWEVRVGFRGEASPRLRKHSCKCDLNKGAALPNDNRPALFLLYRAVGHVSVLSRRFVTNVKQVLSLHPAAGSLIR